MNLGFPYPAGGANIVILTHKWGDSAGANYVWAQVAGMRISSISRHLMVPLRAFVDESADGHLFVLGGAVADAENWANFSYNWEKLLPLAPIRKDGKRHFKFSEMHGRVDDIPAFWRVLQENVRFLVVSVVEIPALRSAQSRIKTPSPIVWGWLQDPYMVAFHQLMYGFHGRRGEFSDLLKETDVVDFYFDSHANEEKIRSGWDGYLSRIPPEYASRFGVKPRFEDDSVFLPLQAQGNRI